jgi:hypothetical protein
MNANDWKIMVAALLDAEGINEKKRLLFARYWLRQYLAKKNPVGALESVKEHSTAFNDEEGVESVISDALGNLAKDDPLAAIEWMKQNAEEFPDAMGAQSRANVIHAAAGKDPDLALSLISELKLDSSSAQDAMVIIVAMAQNDDERNATLAALRKYSEKNKEDKELSSTADRMVGYFSWGFNETGLKGAKEWIDGANLTPKELGAFCDELSRNYRGDENAQWIEWMGAALPPDLGRSPIMDMISRWTDRDPEAAGNWLRAAPDGPTKNAAIRSYALTVFKQDPEAAMRWINTLPPGQDRYYTLKTIYMYWPKDDPAGKEAFAKEHGIN